MVEDEVDPLGIEADDLAEHALALADVAQRVQLGRADDEDPVGHLERGDRRLVEAAAAVDEDGAELALHRAQRGAHVRGGDDLAFFGPRAGDQQLQAASGARP